MQASLLREELLARAENLKTIPTLDAIINKVYEVIADDNASFKNLLEVVKYDQAISSKIISIANSAYFRRGSEIASLERAMMAVGTDEIRRIVMCLVFLTGLLKQSRIDQDDLACLWHHTLSVACAAKVLAQKTMAENGEKVFTVAILHDLGMVPFLMHGDRHRELRQEAQSTGRDICFLEKETFDIDHAELGHFMSLKLKFPDEFSAVIRLHHGGTEGRMTSVGLVAKADRFIIYPQADIGPEGIILQAEAEAIKAETKRVADLLGVV